MSEEKHSPGNSSPPANLAATAPGANPIRPGQRSKSGCTVVLLVVAGLGVLTVGTCGVGAYFAYQDEEVRQAIDVALGMFNAEGRAELMAAGCDMVLVIDSEALANLQGEEAPTEQDLLVTCIVNTTADHPSCDKLAKVYHGALSKPPEVFSLTVVTEGQADYACLAQYGAKGLPTGNPPEVDTNNFGDIPRPQEPDDRLLPNKASNGE